MFLDMEVDQAVVGTTGTRTMATGTPATSMEGNRQLLLSLLPTTVPAILNRPKTVQVKTGRDTYEIGL